MGVLLLGVGVYRCENDSGQAYTRLCGNIGPQLFIGAVASDVGEAATHEFDAEVKAGIGVGGAVSVRTNRVGAVVGAGIALSYCYTTPLTAGLKKP